MWTPFSIDSKGGEMKKEGEMQKKGSMLIGGARLLSSMTKGEIIDEIFIDANMDL